MKAGPNMVEMTILRRAPDADGAATGDFGDAFATWARWSQNPGVLVAVGGQREDKIDLAVTVNDCTSTRTITNADRARLSGVEYEIVSVGLPERRSGTIPLSLAAAANA